MPEHRTDAAAIPAPDDTLRERLAERASLLAVSKSEQAKIVDVLLPTVREHVTAAVQTERERVIAVSNSQELSFLERAERAEAAIERVRDLASDDADLRSGVVGMVRVGDIRRALDGTEATP